MTTLYFIHSVNTYTAQITLRFGNVWRHMPVKTLQAEVLHILHIFKFKLHFSWSSHISNLHHLIAKFIRTQILQALYLLITDCPWMKDTDRHQDQKAVRPANRRHMSILQPTFLHFVQVMYSTTQQVHDLGTHASVVSLNIFCININ